LELWNYGCWHWRNNRLYELSYC